MPAEPVSERRFGRAWWRRRRKRLLQFWGIGLAASVVVTALSTTDYFETSQAKGLDFLIKLRGQQLLSDVVIVAIDDETFEALGQRQPIPRDHLARIVRGLQRSGAAVIGFDIAFTSASSPEDDRALARAIAGFGDGHGSRIVLPSIRPSSGPLADPALLATVPVGSPNIPEDTDGVVRRAAMLVPRSGGGAEPALALAVVARREGVSPEALARRFGQERAGELVRINYAGPAGSFLTLPSRVVAALGEAGAEVPPDNPFRGRIVLVGATFADSRDFFQTPHGPLPGVEVHANVAHMLLTGGLIRPSGWAINFGLQLVAVLVVGVIMVSARPRVANALCFGVPLVVAVPASYVAFNSGGYWLDFVLPAITTKMLGSWATLLERRRFREAFGRYVSKEVAAQVLADPGSLEGERREVSILFSDLRGSTAFAETLPPETVAAQLNELFEAMTAAVFRHRGMVNDFIGDAVMAIFGAPVPDPEHALHAVRAALAMDGALRALNERWSAEGRPQLRMGIGVHTGVVFAGNVGGRDRVKYTIVGDAVNLASRVEGLNKDLGTTMLITEATRAIVGDRAKARDCGPVPVKGRNEPVRLYELFAVEPSSPPGSDGGAPGSDEGA